MRDFTFYVQDERYTVPTVVFVTVADAVRAAELAVERLHESPYHLQVELREEDEPLARVDREGAVWLNAAPDSDR
jgi:hypothetical protein